jgi:membrane protein DedA with SNARE-associated domain
LRKITILTESTTATKPLPPNTIPNQRRRLSIWQILGRVAAVLFAAGITITIFIFAPQIQRFQQYGYPGVFLTSLIGNASIALPIPSLAVTFSMGIALNWVLVGLVAGIGEAIGETTGYLAGFGGSAIIENMQLYKRLQYWMEHHGMLTIFVLSVIPNPIIDLAGISAGVSKYAFYKFFVALWVGKTIKTLVFAWAGSHSIEWLMWFLG